LSTASPALASERTGYGAAVCRRRAHRRGRTPICAVAQSVLCERPACQFRQACPHANVGPDQHCGSHTVALAAAVLGREPAAGATPSPTHARSRWNLSAFDLLPACL